MVYFWPFLISFIQNFILIGQFVFFIDIFFYNHWPTVQLQKKILRGGPMDPWKQPCLTPTLHRAKKCYIWNNFSFPIPKVTKKSIKYTNYIIQCKSRQISNHNRSFNFFIFWHDRKADMVSSNKWILSEKKIMVYKWK